MTNLIKIVKTYLIKVFKTRDRMNQDACLMFNSLAKASQKVERRLKPPLKKVTKSKKKKAQKRQFFS